ncbi:MAG TPA: hypothetical protein PKM44_11160 [Turneriella sp.]|nr:hypothetical protein [Nitrospira sp.]HNL11061.1 hypothetical protein [Turneriella sp.]
MADPAVTFQAPAAAAVSSIPSAAANVTLLEGMVVSVREYGTLFEHSVALPGPDPYTAGGEALLKSKKRFGEGEILKLKCRVTGRKREWERREGRHSEVVRTTDTWLIPFDERH